MYSNHQLNVKLIKMFNIQPLKNRFQSFLHSKNLSSQNWLTTSQNWLGKCLEYGRQRLRVHSYTKKNVIQISKKNFLKEFLFHYHRSCSTELNCTNFVNYYHCY